MIGSFDHGSKAIALAIAGPAEAGPGSETRAPNFGFAKTFTTAPASVSRAQDRSRIPCHQA